MNRYAIILILLFLLKISYNPTISILTEYLYLKIL
jgi:hypothetical protein